MPRKTSAPADEFQEAVNAIEENTCYRLTARDDHDGGYFVAVDGEGTALAPAFFVGPARILALAKVKKPRKRR